MEGAATTLSSASVLLVIHAPTVPIVSERRLPSDVPLSAVRARLELLSGIPLQAQRLSLWSSRTDDPDSRAALVASVPDDDGGSRGSGVRGHEDERTAPAAPGAAGAVTLVSLGARDGMGLKVDDTRGGPVRDQFGAEEEDKVQKYEMDDEAYAQRQDSVLAFKQRNKIGRFAEQQQDAASGADAGQPQPALAAEMAPGARCEVDGHRRGTVRFVGGTAFAPGTWIGVEYDEPVGKNDGQVGTGPRYFTCKPKYGGFVRPEKVAAGDFPERGLDDDEEEEEEEEL